MWGGSTGLVVAILAEAWRRRKCSLRMLFYILTLAALALAGFIEVAWPSAGWPPIDSECLAAGHLGCDTAMKRLERWAARE
jgi:hypothetical protein